MLAVRLASLALLGLAFAPACGSITANATVGPDLDDASAGEGGVVVLPDGAIAPRDSEASATDAADGGFCAGSGPLIPVPGAPDECIGDVANRTFLFAVCACSDVNVSGALVTDSLNSQTGAASQGGGSIGANGAVATNSDLLIGGSVWSSATATTGIADAVHTALSGTVSGDVHAGAAVLVDPQETLTIDGSLYVDGNASGTITCGGSVYIPVGDTATGVTATGGTVQQPVSVPAPCDCADTLAIPSIVNAFATTNDDAAAGLTASSLAPATDPISLPCGEYYFSAISGPSLSLLLTGRTAVFVAGDLDIQGPLTIALAAGAELDLFVTGNVILGDATIGSPNVPANTRVYVGGKTFTLSGTAKLAANFYAPNADVQLSSDFEMSGSLFVGSLEMSGAFTIHYDESILNTTGCAQVGGTCKTCHDCEGATPACIGGSCAPCVTSSDCCAPLSCRAGACVPELK